MVKVPAAGESAKKGHKGTGQLSSTLSAAQVRVRAWANGIYGKAYRLGLRAQGIPGPSIKRWRVEIRTARLIGLG